MRANGAGCIDELVKGAGEGAIAGEQRGAPLGSAASPDRVRLCTAIRLV